MNAAVRGRAGVRALALALLAGTAVGGCGVTIPDLGGWPADEPPSSGGCPATPGQELLVALNRERSRHGLPPLVAHAALARAASAHTADQAEQGRLTHTGRDGSSVGDRVLAEGYRWSSVGENVGGGYATVADVVAGWMDSPGHRALILTAGDNHAGVGYVPDGRQPLRRFWTLVVARPASAEASPGIACHP